MKSDALAISTFGSANYEALPKSVLAQIAYHFAQRIAGEEGNRDAAMAAIATEWDALHANGIVSQKPKKMETVEQEIARFEGYAINGKLTCWQEDRLATLRAMLAAR